MRAEKAVFNTSKLHTMYKNISSSSLLYGVQFSDACCALVGRELVVKGCHFEEVSPRAGVLYDYLNLTADTAPQGSGAS